MRRVSQALGTVAVLLGLTLIPFTIPVAIVVTAWRRWRR